jgi:hypothetical protein
MQDTSRIFYYVNKIFSLMYIYIIINTQLFLLLYLFNKILKYLL